MDKKPVGYVCYLCGAQFGSRSLKIHIKACQKKWVQVEAQKPKREQRKVPDPPPGVDFENLPTTTDGITDFNSQMFTYFDKISLVKCPTCARTFRPDALERHAKACSGGGGGSRGEAPGMTGNSGGGGGGNYNSRPKAYVCYLCGQQYGSQSLKIHIPKCEEKFVKVESQKLKGDRRPLPMRPPEIDDPLPKDSQGIDEFNNKMFAYYNGVSLVKCEKCGRTFNFEALSKHQKGCKGPPPAKSSGNQRSEATCYAGGGSAHPSPMKSKNGGNAANAEDQGDHAAPSQYKLDNLPTEGDEDEQERQQCPDCGRSFNPDVLDRHIRICKKVFATKRKAFDSSKNRVEGTDQQQFAGKLNKQSKSRQQLQQSQDSKKSNWKQQSGQLREAMQAQRKIQQALARGEDIRNIPHVPSAPDPSLVQCPHCGRRFNENAAERHIPKCATTVAKPSFLKAGAKTRGGRF